MRQQDSELERLFSRIHSLEEEYNRARSETDFYREQMNAEWGALHDLQVKYRELKELADEEFRSASLCWEMGDRAGAKEHSDKGKSINEQKAYIGSGLDAAHGRYDPMKAAFERAKDRQNEVLAQLKELKAAKNRRLDELKEQQAREAAHWHEKTCKECGKTIRYRDDWSHIPNFCKDCKAKFEMEQKQRENRKTGRFKNFINGAFTTAGIASAVLNPSNYGPVDQGWDYIQQRREDQMSQVDTGRWNPTSSGE